MYEVNDYNSLSTVVFDMYCYITLKRDLLAIATCFLFCVRPNALNVFCRHKLSTFYCYLPMKTDT